MLRGEGVGECPAGAGADGVGWVACCVSAWEKFGSVNSPEKQTSDKESKDVRVTMMKAVWMGCQAEGDFFFWMDEWMGGWMD